MEIAKNVSLDTCIICISFIIRYFIQIYINIMVKMKMTNYDIIIRVFSEEGVNGR